MTPRGLCEQDNLGCFRESSLQQPDLLVAVFDGLSWLGVQVEFSEPILCKSVFRLKSFWKLLAVALPLASPSPYVLRPALLEDVGDKKPRHGRPLLLESLWHPPIAQTTLPDQGGDRCSPGSCSSYRRLQDVDLQDLKPLNSIVGPNNAGKTFEQTKGKA